MFNLKKNMVKVIEFRPWIELSQKTKIAATPAVTQVPDWYKNLRPFHMADKFSEIKPNLTLKTCVPFLDAMTAGYIVQLSDDILFEKDENGFIVMKWRYGGPLIEPHSLYQTVDQIVPEGYYKQAFKWLFDFASIVPQGYSLWITHPVNRNELPFQTLTGFVDADNYKRPINFPFFIKDNFEGIIEAGTPIAQLIPIKRENWQMKTFDYDENFIIVQDKKFLSKIFRSYKKKSWVKKSFR